MMTFRTLLTLAACLTFTVASGAGGESDGPIGVAQTFHAALSAGDREQVLELLAPEVVIMEQGHIERSRQEYAEHHLPADLKFAQQVRYTLENQFSRVDEGLAWVASEGRIRGEVDGKPVDQIALETLVMRRSDAGWRIVHIHWSSRKAAH